MCIDRMKKENLFYIIFILTIIIARISIIVFPEFDIKFLGVIIHHFWFGVILLAIGLIISEKYESLKLYFYSIGVGLMVDQLVFMILGAGRDKEYWALPSLLGTILLAIIIYPMRARIINVLRHGHKNQEKTY